MNYEKLAQNTKVIVKGLSNLKWWRVKASVGTGIYMISSDARMHLCNRTWSVRSSIKISTFNVDVMIALSSGSVESNYRKTHMIVNARIESYLYKSPKDT